MLPPSWTIQNGRPSKTDFLLISQWKVVELQIDTLFRGSLAKRNLNLVFFTVVLIEIGIFENPKRIGEIITIFYIHKTTTTSFAISLYGQCCRRHVVGQRVVSDISVVCSCSTLCSQSNNANLLVRLVSDVGLLGTSILLRMPKTQLDLQHGGMYPVTMDTEFSDIAAYYLCCAIANGAS